MMSDVMMAVRQHEAGGSLVVEQVSVPVPGKGEVLVKMAAAPFNPSDLSFVSGNYGTPLSYPVTPGFEGSGTVVARGDGIIGRLLMGKRVACTSIPGGDGTWAEFMVTQSTRCAPLSNRVSFEQGSMMLVNPMTVMALLETAMKGKHRAIVNNAAASSLGKMLLVLSKKKKIPLICIVRSESQQQILNQMGAKYILNSSEQGYFENLSALAKKLDATLLFDAIGGKDGSTLIEAAPVKSRIILYAKLSGENIEIDPRNLLRQHKTIEGFQLANFLEDKNIVYKLRLVGRIRRFMNDQERISVQDVFPIMQVNEAIQLYRSGMGKGKVLIKL